MAFPFILSKKHSPDFSNPRVKPVGPVEIDWSNPLTRGLVGCWLMENGSVTRDLTGNNNGVDTGTVKHAYDANGSYSLIEADDTTDRINLGSIDSNNPLNGSETGEITVYSYGVVPDDSQNNFPRIIDKSDGGAGENGWTFYFHEGSETLSINVDGGSSKSSSVNTVSGETIGAAVQIKSSDTIFYINGKPAGTDGVAYTIPSDTTNAALLNWNHTNDRQLNTPCYLVYVWDRPLTADEHSRIHNDRYGILRPKTPPLYLVPGIAPAGVTGTISSTLDDDTGTFTAVLSAIGAINSTLDDDTGVMAGLVGDVVTGTISSTLDDDVGTFTAVLSALGTINSQLDDDTGVMSGIVGDVIVGTINSVLDD